VHGISQASRDITAEHWLEAAVPWLHHLVVWLGWL